MKITAFDTISCMLSQKTPLPRLWLITTQCMQCKSSLYFSIKLILENPYNISIHQSSSILKTSITHFISVKSYTFSKYQSKSQNLSIISHSSLHLSLHYLQYSPESIDCTEEHKTNCCRQHNRRTFYDRRRCICRFCQSGRG